MRYLYKCSRSGRAPSTPQTHSSVALGARNGCCWLRGALALENTDRAHFGAASAGADSALKKAVRACFGAAPASAFGKPVRGCCSRSLFESAGLGYAVLCASLLSSPCFVHGYAQVHTSNTYICLHVNLGFLSVLTAMPTHHLVESRRSQAPPKVGVSMQVFQQDGGPFVQEERPMQKRWWSLSICKKHQQALQQIYRTQMCFSPRCLFPSTFL